MSCVQCREPVVGFALAYCQRVGTSLRCGGTHCKRLDSALAEALRTMAPAPRPRPSPAEAAASERRSREVKRALDELPVTPTLNLARRVVVLEETLRRHGIEVPP